MWRIDLEVDGLASDALVVAGHSGGLILDLALDVAKVGVAPVEMEELAPLGELGWVFRHGGVDELKDEGSARDDA